MPDTETIDRLFLELSQITTAKTSREIDLENRLARVGLILRDAGDVESLDERQFSNLRKLANPES